MKVGDLVKWVQPGLPVQGEHSGIIVDGPREGFQGVEKCSSYAVAWFTHKKTMWHTDYNLEMVSESSN